MLLNSPDAVPMTAQDGWQLYTSSDGFPYFFNHASGQSEWAHFQPPGAHGSTTNEAISVAMVTAPSMEVAKKIAHTLVKEKLAACVQLQDKITSVYEWENVVEETTEVLLIIKVS